MNTDVCKLAENIADSDVKNNFLNFIGFCESLRLRPRLYASEKMNIKFRGKRILRFDPSVLNGNLYLFFTVSYSSELQDLLSKLPDDMQSAFLENVDRRCKHEECIACKPNPKRKYRILGSVHELCSNEMRFVNPTKEQFEYLKKWVVVRKEFISATAK